MKNLHSFLFAFLCMAASLSAFSQAETQNPSSGNGLYWRITGNTGTVDGTNFIGTIDNVPFNIRINNLRAGRITNATTGQTFYGFQAGNSITGNNNTMLGTNTGQNLTTGVENVGIGPYALTGAPGATSSANTAVGFYALNATTTGNQNTAMGHYALSSNTTGVLNCAYGAGCMDAFQTGSFNTASGFWALRGLSLASGSYNAAYGYQSMYSATTGSYNTAVGVFALRNVFSGNYNVAIGDSALYAYSATGYMNTAVGHVAMRHTTTGGANTALGSFSLYRNTSGINNTAVGNAALERNTTGSNSTAVGNGALQNCTTSTDNVAVGHFAMNGTSNSSVSTALGAEAMQFDSTGTMNTAVGWRALRNRKLGAENTAIGVGALEVARSVSFNTALGRGAGLNTSGDQNTFLGYAAAWFDSSTGATISGAYAGYYNMGDYNTFYGYNAGRGSGIGSGVTLEKGRGLENSALGAFALQHIYFGNSNTSLGFGSMYWAYNGSGNVAIGTRALHGDVFKVNGSYNVAVGDSAAHLNRNGSRNIAIGAHALLSNSNSNGNVAVGDSALFSYTNPSYMNTAIGYTSQRNVTSGTGNTSLGSFTLHRNTAGVNNTAVGDGALRNINTSNNTAIGYQSGNSILTGTHHTLLGAGTNANEGLSYATAVGAGAFAGSSNSIILGRTTAPVRVSIGDNFTYTNYKLYTYHQQLTADGDGQHTIYGFRARDSQNDGTGYGYALSNTANSGYNDWGDMYSFGVGGYTWNDFTRNGGVLGAFQNGNYWGSLGYKTSASVNVGVYGTSSATGAGFLPNGNEGHTGIGGAFYGGIIGAWSRGEVMGHIAAGDLFAGYNLGNEFTSGYKADIVSNGQKRTAAFGVTSSDLKVYTDGNHTLSGTSVFVPFDDNFKYLIANTPNVTITPVGQSAQLYISSISKEGFTVASDAPVNIQFNWMAAAKRADAETAAKVPADLLQPSFEENMKKVLFNEGNTEQSGTPIWHDGKKIRFDKAPEKPVERKNENYGRTRTPN